MPSMIPLSILDLAPIPEGSSAGDALRNSADLARHAEALGFTRYWMAEHHNMPGIASAATSVALAHVAQATSRIRRQPGLGRAPGSDQATAYAMRRNLAGDSDDFPRDVVELMRYFAPAEPGQRIQAVPGAGLAVACWILGSSTYGAQLAALLGLPYAFASHFAPQMLMDAIALYREGFRPAAAGDTPHLMLGCGVVLAETDEEARYLFTSQQQSFVNLRTGRPGKLPPPVAGYYESLDPRARMMIDHSLSCCFVGSPTTVRGLLEAFIARTGADELMVTANIHDPALRQRSYTLLAEAHPLAVAA